MASWNAWRPPSWVWVLPLLLALLGAMHWISRPAAVSGVENVTHAWIEPLDAGSQPLRPPRRVALPHDFDREFDAAQPLVRYRIDWPQALSYADPAQARLALLLPRVGARYRLLLNGHEIGQVGWHAAPDRLCNAAVEPYYVALPAGLLAPLPQDNRIELLVRGQRFERSGLWPLQLGAQDKVYRRYTTLETWQVGGGWMMLVTTALMGLFAASLWRLQRERAYALIALASLAHALWIWLGQLQEPPLPHSLFFLLHRASFSTYIGLMMLFFDELSGLRVKLARWLSGAVIACSPLWLIAVLLSDSLALQTAWSAMIVLAGALTLATVLWRSRLGRLLDDDQRLLVIVGHFVLIAGLRDTLVGRLGFPGDADLRWILPSVLVLTLMLFWILLRRSTESVREVRRLNATLAHRVAEREAELLEAFGRLRLSEQQRVLETERRRLMRDMHDGVGSQLVQTLNFVRNSRGELDAARVAALLQQALEELRLMLDSLEPMEGDLPTILGTLRQRIAPLLESAGVELDWQVEETPPLAHLDSRGVMNLFRCLQELFANVAKHASARRVSVRTWADAAGSVFLAIEDDGIGSRAAALQGAATRGSGRGLSNIRARAEQIGAQLRFYDARPGFGVEFRFPAPANAE